MPRIDMQHEITLLPAHSLDKIVCLWPRAFHCLCYSELSTELCVQVHSKHRSLCLAKSASCFWCFIYLFILIPVQKICAPNINTLGRDTTLTPEPCVRPPPLVLVSRRLRNWCRLSGSICGNATSGFSAKLVPGVSKPRRDDPHPRTLWQTSSSSVASVIPQISDTRGRDNTLHPNELVMTTSWSAAQTLYAKLLFMMSHFTH